ncbi:phage portal protein [Bifidobacterium crudilactis]|jgi:hypothetical protein|uniref:phage portal protein n=1 Tax=Bifidobacterium crudilactis TaxID=327277 RepID=UPI002F35D3AD
MTRTAEQINADVNLLARKIMFRRPDIEKHVGYYKGRRGKLNFASEEFKMYMKERFSDFSDNWCAPVAQAPVERIHFQGFKSLDGLEVPSTVQRRWADNDADRGLSEAALMMTIARRSYGLVTEKPNGKARISFEHPDSAAVLYDARTGQVRAGLVMVQDDAEEYGTLMYPDAIFQVQRKRSAFVDDANRQPPSTDGWRFVPESFMPNPLGAVPLVEFRNQSLLDMNPQSDIEPVESMQDAVNVVWSYLLNALDYASMPARVIMGGEPLEEPVLDNEGKVVGARPAELDKTVTDRITQLTGDSKIGEWTSSNLEAFNPVIEKAVEHIAAETRTPGHYLLTNAEVPATGYEVAEAGLVSKTVDRIRYLRSGIRELSRLAALTEGDEQAAKAVANAEVVFASPQYRSQAVMTQGMLQMRQAGFPLEFLLEWFGLAPDEVSRVMVMKRQEDADPELAAIAKSIGVSHGHDDSGAQQSELGGTGDAGAQAGEKNVAANQPG